MRADVYRGLGDIGRTASMLAELEPRLARMMPAGHVAFGSLASQQALLAEARGDLVAALAAADRAIAMARSSVEPGAFSKQIGLAQLALDRALHAQGRIEPARTALGSTVEHLTPTLGADHPDTRLARELAARTARTS